MSEWWPGGNTSEPRRDGNRVAGGYTDMSSHDFFSFLILSNSMTTPSRRGHNYDSDGISARVVQ